jgi:four helix bundle protein
MDFKRIYPRSLELVRLSHAVIEKLPAGYGFLADQLRRASSSVVLNFAEGTGKRSAADRRRYFASARGSACEVSACFDLALAFDATTPDEHAAGCDVCDHLAAMLTRFATASP